VHIAQFAELLCDRQVVIAFRERALFDYLTLESSRCFPGHSLIAVEITRTFEGKAVVTAAPSALEPTERSRPDLLATSLAQGLVRPVV